MNFFVMNFFVMNFFVRNFFVMNFFVMNFLVMNFFFSNWDRKIKILCSFGVDLMIQSASLKITEPNKEPTAREICGPDGAIL